MATQVQNRRGTTTEHATFTGAAGELTVDTTKKTVVVHDGSTAGGVPLLRENGSQNAVTTGTSTAASFIPTSSTAPTNGVYLSAANSVSIATGSTQRLLIDSAGQIEAASLGSASAPTWSFTGDPNTGIYSPGADQLAITTNGTQRVTVDTAATTSTLPVVHPLGAVGTPSITFTGDLNTGIWSPAADTIAASTGGSERLRIDSSGRVGIGTTDPAEKLEVRDGNIGLDSAGSTVGDRTTERFYKRTDNGSTNGMAAIGMNGAGTNGFLGEIKFYTGASDVFNTSLSERVRIDSSGRLLVGTSSAIAATTLTPALQHHGYSGDTATAGFGRWSNDNGGYALYFAKSRGSVGSQAIVSDGDFLGALFFEGSDGTQLRRGASISANVDGTPGSGDMPGRLVFSTTADGASSPTERLRITSAGLVGIGTANADQLLSVGTATNADLGPFGISLGVCISGTPVSRGALIEKNTNASDLGLRIYAGRGAITSPTIFYRTNTLESARLDSDGRLLVGASSARANYGNSTLSAQLQVEGTGFSNSAISTTRNSNDTFGAAVVLNKSRGAAVGSNTLPSNGDEIGGLHFQASDGTEFVPAARIDAFVDGTPGANDMPGRLVLSTTRDGQSSPTTAVTIDSSQRLLVGTSSATANGGVLQVSNGITFPATQSACSDPNTLDDYEEGSCTITLSDSLGNNATMGAGNVFQYRKIGSFVLVSGTLVWSSTSALSAGSRIQLTGLPFASNGTTGMRWVAIFGSSSSGSFLITRSEINFGLDYGYSFAWGTKISGNNVDNNLTKADLGSSGVLYGFTLSYNT